MGGLSVCAIGAIPDVRAPGTVACAGDGAGGESGTGTAFGIVMGCPSLAPALRASSTTSAVLKADVGVGMVWYSCTSPVLARSTVGTEPSSSG